MLCHYHSSVVSFAPTSQVRKDVILVLFVVGNKKIRKVCGFK